MNFESFYNLIFEAAALKTAEQYFTEKFGRIKETLQQYKGKLHYTTVNALANKLNSVHSNIIKAHGIFKNNTQMEYFLFWSKAIFLYHIIINHLVVTLETEKLDAEQKAIYEELYRYFRIEQERHENKGKKRGMKPFNSINFVEYSDNAFLMHMEHLLSLNIHSIDNYNFFSGFPTFPELVSTLDNLEKEHYAKFQGYLFPEDLGKQEKVIKEFSLDGSNYVWVNTHESTTCDKEAKLMKHCGNSYHSNRDGDEVFSLREILVIDQKTVYKPILTFIVNDLILRESKGSANDKPSEKYHKHIVELLKTGEILHVFQKDSYKAQNNFYFTDLSKELQKEVEDKFEEEGWEFNLEDESMNFDKQIEQSERLIKTANEDFDFIDLSMDESDSYISYYMSGALEFPFLTEEFWDKYKDHFEDITQYTEGNSDDVQFQEYTNDEGKHRQYISMYFRSDESFNLETGEGYGSSGRTGGDVFDTTKDAIQSAAYLDREIPREISNAITKILEHIEENPETDPNIDLNLLINFNSLPTGDIKYARGKLVLSIGIKINDYMTYNALSKEHQEQLVAKTRSFISKQLAHLDPRTTYGTHDLLIMEFLPPDVMEQINEMQIVIETGNRSYYSARKESVFINIHVPDELYAVFSKYLTNKFWQDLYEKASTFVLANLVDEKSLPAESFRHLIRSKLR